MGNFSWLKTRGIEAKWCAGVGETKPRMAQPGQQHHFPAIPEKSQPQVMLWEKQRWSWGSLVALIDLKTHSGASPSLPSQRSHSAAAWGPSTSRRNPSVFQPKFGLWAILQQCSLISVPIEGPSASGNVGSCSLRTQEFGLNGMERGGKGGTTGGVGLLWCGRSNHV